MCFSIAMRLSHRRRAAAAFAALGCALPALGIMVPAPAGAEGYPFCEAKVDPDCFLLNRVNERLGSITPGSEANLIAAGHRACEFMTTDTSGTNPMLDYGVWLAQQPGGDKSVISNASQFALYAAKAYCPSVLP